MLPLNMELLETIFAREGWPGSYWPAASRCKAAAVKIREIPAKFRYPADSARFRHFPRSRRFHLRAEPVNLRPAHPFRSPISMQFIVISALGSDRTGLVYDLTRIVLDCNGNIVDSRMTALGSEFAMLLLVSGNWHTLAKLETELKKLGDAGGVTVSVRRTEPRAARRDVVTYSVDVVCLDQPGVVHNLAGFFSSRGIDIAELSTRSYAAAHTGAPMFAVQMVVHIPAKIHIAALREEFMDLCDQLNLDAILEPVKA
jgi:glycine cleavage system transcriptional repressor